MTIISSVILATHTPHTKQFASANRKSHLTYPKLTQNSLKTAHHNRLSSKLFAASDDTDKILTKENVRQIFLELQKEQEKSRSVNFGAKILTGENITIAGFFSTIIILYLGLTMQINGISQRFDDKADANMKISNDKADANMKISNDNYDKLKDLINIDIRTKITNLENKTDNLAGDIKNLENKTDNLAGDIKNLEKKTDNLDKKIEAKKGLFLHLQGTLSSFPDIISHTKK